MGVAGQGKGSVLVSEQQAGRHLLGVLDAGVSFRGTEAVLHRLGASAPGAVSGGGGAPQAGSVLLSGQPKWGDVVNKFFSLLASGRKM